MDSESLIRGLCLPIVPNTHLDDLPASPNLPAVRITLLDGEEANSLQPVWVERPHYEIEVFATSKPEASQLARQLRNHLLSAPRKGSAPEGTVSYVRASHPRWNPEPELLTVNGEATPCYLFVARLTIHPNRQGESQ